MSRAQRYREQAARCAGLAEQAIDPQIREGFTSVEKEWLVLARQADADEAREAGPRSPAQEGDG